MLAYVLALAVGLGSFAIYMAAFFFPEIHRKGDFIWSGVGLFYALVLWVCAGRITGGLLLGEVAGVALLGWSVTQTLQLRRQLTPSQEQTELPSVEEVKNTVQEKVSNLSIPERLSQLGDRLSGSFTGVKDQIQQRVSGVSQRKSQSDSPLTGAPTGATGEAMPAVFNAPAVQPNVEIIDHRTPIPEQPANIAATEPDELVQAARESAAVEDAPSSIQELQPEADELIEPVLTEEEAIALAVETTLAEAALAEALQENQEGSVSEPMRPNPPDPEIVEAAIRDAEEKEQEASPPDIEPTKNKEEGNRQNAKDAKKDWID